VSDPPRVSVIIATRDRPRLLAIALRCYELQTYPNRELIVVDDGEVAPADAASVEAIGANLIRVEPGTPLGVKLNHGARAANGMFCQKMDDDDWYAPTFVETMVQSVLQSWTIVRRPTIAVLMGFLFFDVARWEVRRSTPENAPGATLFFEREVWDEHPFRGVPRDEDVWFYMDQIRHGGVCVTVDAPETFLAVRHGGSQRDRGHTWTQQLDGKRLESYLQDLPQHDGGPEALLPEWALAEYRSLRDELNAVPATADQGAT
jgi:glycosyltransferase involved in cell wall biosynthesis